MKLLNRITRRASPDDSIYNRLGIGIGIKIILPYFLLTLIVASAGAYVVTNLVASSLRERFNNQLLDAGRVVSESMVRYEEERLQTLRAVAGTEGIPQSLSAADYETLATLIPPIIANSNTDALVLLDMNGTAVYSWPPPSDQAEFSPEQTTSDFSQSEDVRLVLAGYVDISNKRVFLHETPGGVTIFTVGPVLHNGEQVGAALVGTYVHRTMIDLTLNAVARVTLYDRNGNVIDTTLGSGDETITSLFQESPEQYETITALLEESPDQYQVVIENAEDQTSLRQVEVMDQQYLLAFGDWRLRGQSFGLFSVALPTNFIFTTVAASRNRFSLLFMLAMVFVIIVGLFIAQYISRPLNRLAQIAVAVAQGDLNQRSGIHRNDEIGKLAYSLDVMTEKLAERNRQLIEQASRLEAILQSIADGVIVLDMDDEIITLNQAANRLLADMSYDFSAGPLRELSASFSSDNSDAVSDDQLPATIWQPRRYRVGNRVLSTLAAPVQTPDGARFGTVIVLRDITQEVEAEHLKDAFITSVSHELRTPLTVIKVYADLMLKTANGHLNERQLKFIQNINRGSEQLEHHINQLINISEIQAGTIKLEQKRIRFLDLIRSIADNWQEKMKSKNLSFHVRLPQKSLWLYADAAQLGWATDNLLRNAYTYTPEGGHVEVHVFEEKGEVRLDVIDNGVGIASADQPHLFDRFFRATNAINYDVRGVGLGLFITRSIVELHNGRIWVNSELGSGSTFSMALPLIKNGN